MKELESKIREVKLASKKEGPRYIARKREVVGRIFLERYKDKMDELKKILDIDLKNKKDRKFFGLDPKVKKEDTNSETNSDPTGSTTKSPYWKKSGKNFLNDFN